jgi:hypothetical protein
MRRSTADAIAGHYPRGKGRRIARPRSVAQARNGTEELLQEAIIAWCRTQARRRPGLETVWFFPAYRYLPGSAGQRMGQFDHLERLGLPVGYPDLLLDLPRRSTKPPFKLFHGARMELKAPGKKPKPKQREKMELLAGRGFAVCWQDQFEAAVKWWTDYYDGLL